MNITLAKTKWQYQVHRLIEQHIYLYISLAIHISLSRHRCFHRIFKMNKDETVVDNWKHNACHVQTALATQWMFLLSCRWHHAYLCKLTEPRWWLWLILHVWLTFNQSEMLLKMVNPRTTHLIKLYMLNRKTNPTITNNNRYYSTGLNYSRLFLKTQFPLDVLFLI